MVSLVTLLMGLLIQRVISKKQGNWGLLKCQKKHVRNYKIFLDTLYSCVRSPISQMCEKKSTKMKYMRRAKKINLNGEKLHVKDSKSQFVLQTLLYMTHTCLY